MKQRYIDVEQEGNHIRLRVGQIIMHSEEYSSPSNAKRAARNLVKAINERPMRLSWWHGKHGSMVRKTELVRKVWRAGANRTVIIPTDVSVDAYRGAYFDPAIESAGL